MKTTMNIAQRRLFTQHIAAQKLEKPADIVRWLGAVQSQDYAGAKWAVGQRMLSATDDIVEQAFAKGEILRTHVMRPTWHFVAPEDIRWLLELTAPRFSGTTPYYARALGLDDALLIKGNDIIARALEGGKQLTRTELMSALQQEGINTEDPAVGVHYMMRAERDGIICSGARQGKQFTYALIDDVVPPTQALQRDEALRELTLRFFRSHGPATERDFAWWSGLTLTDIRAGLEMLKSQLVREEIDGIPYWSGLDSLDIPDEIETEPEIYLLPNYDEYIVAYTDRSAIMGRVDDEKLDARGNVLFNNTVIVDGKIAGTWKRTLKKDSALLEATLFSELTEAERSAFSSQVERYGQYLGLPVSMVVL